MKPHPVDPTALVAGLLFTLSGLAIVADQTWSGLDTTAVVAAAVSLLGVVFAVVLIARAVKEQNPPPAAGESGQTAS